MKLTFFLLSFFATTTAALAQSLSGSVIDENENVPLISAFVVLKNIDTGSRKSAVSDNQGAFYFENISSGKYLLEVSYLGYQTISKDIEIADQNLDLGVLSLQEESATLGEIIVKEKLPLAVQNGDTTAYNADAFKTNPDASAEDLVQKMPGVTMENGRVQAQGEDVKEVLVDGKPFFGNDPTAALKNLPAEVVEKIEVFDKKSDQSQFTGFDDGETSKTMNIITRKNMRNGQFGKAFAGGGIDKDADGKYHAGGSINFFDGDRRISVIGQSNNINIQNFATEDLVGVVGTNRGRRRGGKGGRGSNGSSANDFLVSSQDGISTTHAFGLNYSDEWGEKLKVSGSYFFNKSNNHSDEFINREYIDIADASQFYTEDSENSSSNLNHRFNFNLEYKINDANSIIFRPRVSFQQNDGISATFAKTTERGLVLNQTLNEYSSDLKALTLSGNLLYRHKFAKQRRTFSINLSNSYNDKSGESNLFSQSDYFRNTTESDTLDQFADLVVEGWTVGSNFAYTEPVGKSGMLMMNYRLSLQKDDSNKETFDFSKTSQDYDLFSTDLSNVFKSEKLTNQGGLGYNLRKGKGMFMLRLTAQNTELKNAQTFPTALESKRNFFNILPMAMYRYRASKTNNLRFFYRARTNLPDIEQLQNVIDNTNPLQLSMGNPDLKQAVQHSLSLRYSKTNTEKSTVFYVLLGGEYGSDYISNATYLANSGHPIFSDLGITDDAQLEAPVNLNGYWNARSFVTYGLPLVALKSNLNFNISANYSRIPGQINNDINFSNNTTSGLGLTLSSNISEKVDFTITSKSNYTFVRNSLQAALNSEYFNQFSQIKMNWIFWKSIVFQTDIQHQYYGGLLDDADQNYLLWNVGIGKKIFKNQRGDIRLTVFDLLNQNRNFHRNVTDIYIEDKETVSLQRYVMLTFSYQLRHFVKNAPTEKPKEDRRGRW